MPTPIPPINEVLRVMSRRYPNGHELTNAQARDIYAALPDDAPELLEPKPDAAQATTPTPTSGGSINDDEHTTYE